MNYQDKTKEELIRELQVLKELNSALKSSSEKDIADCKKSEEKLVQSSDLLSNLACLVPGVIYQYRMYEDGRSAFPYSSLGMNEIYEVTPEEVQEDATPVFGRLHPDDYAHVVDSIQESARNLQTFYCEYRVNLPIQGIGWRWSQAYPERLSDGSTLWHGIILDITERKQSEAILEETVAELRKSQRIAHVGNWKLNLLTNKFMASDEGLRIFGFPKGSNPKFQDVSDCIHPEDVERVSKILKQAIQQKESYAVEMRIFHKETGQLRNVHSFGELQFGADGMPNAIIGTNQDITDFKKVENELRETNITIKREQHEKEALINSSKDYIWSVDRDLKLIAANDAFLKSTENTSGQKLKCGNDVLDSNLFSNDLITFWRSLYNNVLNGHTIRKEIYREKPNNSDSTWMELTLNPIYLDTEIIGVACFGNDITEHRVVENQLKLLSRVIEQSPVSVVITNVEGNIEYANPKFTQLTGYTFDEVKGENPRILQSGIHPKAFYEELWNTILSGNEWSGEFQNKKKNGEAYWESAIISSILNRKGEISYFVAVKEDITDKKKMVEDLMKAKEKAEESDKLKTIFLNNISHEIRTPFNGILGFLSILQNDDLNSIERDEYIGIINNNSYRLMGAINNIVEISQIQARQIKLTPSDTNIRILTDDLFINYKSEVKDKGLDFRFHNTLPENIESVYTDRTKLNAILSNLLDNALKFTMHGSIDFGICMVGDDIQFSIKDTGIGIPENKKPTIFERFMQVNLTKNRQFEGLGLGLSISKAYVEMLGGKIWVESNEGEGSAFYLSIPYRSTSVDSNIINSAISTKIIEQKINNLKILIAEDDETSLDLITYLVKKIGKIIIAVRSGDDAVEACRNNPDIDLVLMDIKMPLMNGYEATKQIRLFNPSVIIIAQTAFALTGDQEKAIEAGCNDYISKPFKKDELMALLHKYFK